MDRVTFQFALLLCVAAFAWWRGDRPERYASSAMVVHVLADQVYHFFVAGPGNYRDIHPWHFGLDTLLLAIFVCIGLRAQRLWPLWLGGAQLLAVAGHLLRIVDRDMNPLVYAILDRTPFWIAMAIIAVNTMMSVRRRMTASNS